SPEGDKTVTYTNASTGGAVYAFALGSKLRRPAQATLVTYRDGTPVGLQPVDFETSGEVSVQDYIPLDLDESEDQDPQGGGEVSPSPTPSPSPTARTP